MSTGLPAAAVQTAGGGASPRGWQKWVWLGRQAWYIALRIEALLQVLASKANELCHFNLSQSHF